MPLTPAPARSARQVVVMGVSGCGKSSLGQALAQAMGCRFLEGDSLHPPRNVALMAAGTPLTDDDRRDWLASIGAQLAQAQGAGQALVVSCSALKRRYRDGLRAACPGLRFVLLHGSSALLRQRLQQRSHHYMPATLLDSQLAALEWPGADEHIAVLAIESAPALQLQHALQGLGLADQPPGTSPPIPG